MNTQERVARKLEEAKKATGSYKAVADELGVSKPTVSQWKSGERKPDLDHWFHLEELAKRAALVFAFCMVGALHSTEADASNKDVTGFAKSLIQKGSASPACILCKIAIAQIIEKARKFALRMLNMLSMPVHCAG